MHVVPQLGAIAQRKVDIAYEVVSNVNYALLSDMAAGSLASQREAGSMVDDVINDLGRADHAVESAITASRGDAMARDALFGVRSLLTDARRSADVIFPQRQTIEGSTDIGFEGAASSAASKASHAAEFELLQLHLGIPAHRL